MRRYLGPLIALGVFAVLLIVVLATQGGGNATPTPLAATTPTLSAADRELQILALPATETVNQLEIKTVTSTATLKLENNSWKRTAPSALDLDSSIISDTVRQLTTLRGTSLVPAQNAANLATYGLDKPSLTVTLTTAGSGPKGLNFGTLNQATGNYYVKLADDARVWTVSSFYVNTLLTWLTSPPTPAPSVAPIGNPLTPLPSVTPTAPPTQPPTPAVPTTSAAPPATTVAPAPTPTP